MKWVQSATFIITDAKLYVPVVTPSTQDNTKVFELLKSGFKRKINWNKYKAKKVIKTQNLHFDYLIDPGFQRINRLVMLLIENNNHRISHKRDFLPTVEIKYYNVMIGGRNFFDQPIRINIKTYENIRKIAIGQGNDYTTGCFIHYPYFKKS